ncbi:hypothetical protein LINPERHAP2_LOCUS16978 [Linum perenne]
MSFRPLCCHDCGGAYGSMPLYSIFVEIPSEVLRASLGL